MLRRSGFKRPQIERKPIVYTPIEEKHRRAVSMGQAELVAIEKTVAQRNRHLLDMARGHDCMMQIPGVCNNNPETVVAAHSNSSRHGKSGARKADDNYVIYACAACHTALDQGGAPKVVKDGWWEAGWGRQIASWERTKKSPQSAPKDRAAATWALELSGCLPSS